MFINVCHWPEGDKAQVCALCALRALFVVRRAFFGRCWSQCRRVLSIEYRIYLDIWYDIYLYLYHSRSWHLYAIFQNSKTIKVQRSWFLESCWMFVTFFLTLSAVFLHLSAICFSFLSLPFSDLSLNHLQSRFEMVLAKSCPTFVRSMPFGTYSSYAKSRLLQQHLSIFRYI